MLTKFKFSVYKINNLYILKNVFSTSDFGVSFKSPHHRCEKRIDVLAVSEQLTKPSRSFAVCGKFYHLPNQRTIC